MMATVVQLTRVPLPPVARMFVQHVVLARTAPATGLTAVPHLHRAFPHVNLYPRPTRATIGISLPVALSKLATLATARHFFSREDLGGPRSISSRPRGTPNCLSTTLLLLWILLEAPFRTQIARVHSIKRPLCCKLPAHRPHHLPLSRRSSRLVRVCSVITARTIATTASRKTAPHPSVFHVRSASTSRIDRFPSRLSLMLTEPRNCSRAIVQIPCS